MYVRQRQTRVVVVCMMGEGQQDRPRCRDASKADQQRASCVYVCMCGGGGGDVCGRRRGGVLCCVCGEGGGVTYSSTSILGHSLTE